MFLDDIDRIMYVMEAGFDPAFGEAWNRRQLSDALTLPTTHYHLIGGDGGMALKDGDAPAGFALTRAAPGEEELLLIAVLPDHRGKRLGRNLLAAFEDKARSRNAERIFLEMRANNPAESLYRSAGFEPIGRRKAYYTLANGEKIDAITFGKDL